MRIAIDAMGGDQAPAKIVQGALDALALLDADDELILVGQPDAIQAAAGAALGADRRVRIEPASQVVTMDDSPVEAIRGKRDSSIVKMVKLAGSGGADAIISAGNTGALVAAGVLMLKPLPGVERPGIACSIPTASGRPFMLCDAGANPQAKAIHLYHYAVMCNLYSQTLHKVESPRIAVLNIGTEDEKGTPLVKEARELIQADKSLNFVGYIEPREVFKGEVDVVVTDGFTGNVMLKLIEGCTEMTLMVVGREFMTAAPDSMSLFSATMKRVMKTFDYEEYGGALLLGVSGLFFKIHGASGARAVKNAVAGAKAAARLDVNKQIIARLGKPA